jgi:hypothetical protein
MSDPYSQDPQPWQYPPPPQQQYPQQQYPQQQYPPPPQQYPQQQYPQQQYPPPQPPYVIAARPPYDGLAITSFILGVLWFGWLGSILAVILGHIALRNIRRTNASGRGLAIAGLILGYIGLSTLALFILFGVLGAVTGSSSGSG